MSAGGRPAASIDLPLVNALTSGLLEDVHGFSRCE